VGESKTLKALQFAPQARTNSIGMFMMVLKRKNKFRRVMKGVWAFLKTPLGVAFGIYGFC